MGKVLQALSLAPNLSLGLEMSCFSLLHAAGNANSDLTGSLVFLGISLDVDADRDGVVEKNNPRKVTPPV